MKFIILIIASGILLSTCSLTNTDTENIDLVKNYVRAVEELDFEGMEQYLADNYMGLGPSYGDTIYRDQAVSNWKWNVDNLYEKIHYSRSRFASVTIPDGDNKGNWVANWAELTITYKDNQGSATIWANTNYLIDNGKIIRSLSFYNEADVLRQLGYMISQPDMNN